MRHLHTLCLFVGVFAMAGCMSGCAVQWVLEETGVVRYRMYYEEWNAAFGKMFVGLATGVLTGCLLHIWRRTQQENPPADD